MIKLAFAVLLFGIIVCSAFNQNNAYNFDEDNDYQEFDQTANFYQPENDDHDFLDYDADFGDDESEEINAITGHVKYQDAARDALLKFAARLRKGKNVTNAFLKVIDNFEKGIAEFHAALRGRSVKPGTISNIKNFIKEAAKNRTANTKIIRELTSQGLFMAERGEKSRARKRRDASLILGADDFLNDILKKIGEEAFDKALSINGLVTLMFVIDDTGSMGSQIDAAIAISKQIVKANRAYDVDYILSPFNDPTTGPLTRKDETEGDEFLTALQALRAHGGGDCPELAFAGMINALEAGPQPASSMFVFTDASPKDASEKNKKYVRELALDLEIKINFFATDPVCGSNDKPYREIAKKTNGLFYPLKTTLDLKRLGTLVADSLKVPVPLGSGGSGGSKGRRRRTANMKYSISVDDSIEKISISVTTQNSGTYVRLIDPNRKSVKVGRVSFSKGVVYNIENPVTGIYKLIIPASAGKHTYRVSGVSGMNVDFGHYYVAIAKRGTRIPIPLDQPLKGFPAKTFITVAGAELLKKGSLRIKVVDKSGTVRADKNLNAVGTTNVRYFVRFKPPTGPFKLQLYGQTRKGSSFVRETSRQDRTVSVLLKLAYKEDFNVLRRGRTTWISIRILRGKTGPRRQKYTLRLKDDRGYGRLYRAPRPVYRGRQGFAGIIFIVPANAPVRKTENVKLSLIKAGETKPVASLMFSFLLL